MSTAPRLALPGLREVYEAYVRAADELTGLPGALPAELWTSAQLGMLEAAAPHAAGHRGALADLVQCLWRAGTPGARAFLLAMAAIGPVEARTAAGKAAASLTAVPGPAWAGSLGRVVPGQAWLIQDGGLAGDRLVVEYRYADGTALHAIAARLAPDVLTALVVVGDVPAMMADVRRAVQAELCVAQPLGRGTAAARLAPAFAATGPPDDCRPPLALARHRAALLT